MCKIKDKILDLYKLHRVRGRPADLSATVAALRRDDAFIFDHDDRKVDGQRVRTGFSS